MAISEPMNALAFYDNNVHLYGRLMDEVLFGLRQVTSHAHIKTHTITGRVKPRASVAEKIERKGYENPEAEVQDIVGARVVVLFLSDLPTVGREISGLFEILRTEDRVEGGSEDSFGYMSVHYICRLDINAAGPRYDSLHGMVFEIQVRTLLMDAWANVSHYLAYKGDASIPSALRRDFFALSGLFYVADKHFEMFFGRAEDTKTAATKELQEDDPSSGELDLNLESAIALLENLYPDRGRSEREHVSDFVEEVSRIGYNTVGDLAALLTAARKAADAFEKDHPPAGVDQRYTEVGIARQALAIADPRYADLKYPGVRVREDGGFREDEFAEYRPLIEPVGE